MGCRRWVPTALATLLVAAVTLLAACTTATPTPTTTGTSTPTTAPVPKPMATPTTVAPPTPTQAATAKLEPSVPGQSTVVVALGQGSFFALVADTPELRALGLSGRDYLPRDWGMWFDLGGVGFVDFWMRGMRFPLDIVWIDESLRVVHVTHDAPVPDAVESSLPMYTAEPIHTRYVLEIGAGLARELGIGPGVAVTVMPAP